MAKKKSRKRRSSQRRPAHTAPPAASKTQTAEAEHPASKRAERKEEARKERERRIKHARRRQRTRRLVRWGIAAAVILGIGGLVAWNVVQGRRAAQEAEQAAGLVGCEPAETLQDQVDAAAALDQETLHSPPFGQGEGGVPLTAGRHSSTIEGGVYRQPVDEANTLHNLEHGYVVVYYAAEGPNALDPGHLEGLEGYVEAEEKIILAPYPDLANGVDFVAWGQLQTCDPPADADSGDLVTVLRGFVDEYRSGGLAPEPAGV